MKLWSKKTVIQGIMLIIMLFTLSACSSNRTVTVSYDVSSKSYRCDSAVMGDASTPVHFILPNNHEDMVITFITSEVFGFTQSYSDAIATNQFLQPFGELYTASSIPDSLDLATELLSTGIKAAVMYYTDENGIGMTLAQNITGYQAGIYYITVLDNDNNELLSGQIPVGKTEMFLSKSAKLVDIYSYVEPGLNSFFKAKPVPGSVAYENAHVINESYIKSLDEDTEDFSITGTWKSVGSYGFGQAQPGALVTFGDNHCNFYSPNDTYTFSYENDIGTLECTNWLYKDDVLTFTVKILDNDNITITHGKAYTTILKRVK